MARLGPADATITYNSQVISDVTVVGDLETEGIVEDVTAVGNAAEAHAYIGVKRMGLITLEAPYDGAATATLLRAQCDTVGLGGTATLLITYGGGKTTSVSTILKSVRRKLERGKFTSYQATLQPTGTITEA